jgi:hypothetical protein
MTRQFLVYIGVVALPLVALNGFICAKYWMFR